MISIELTAIVDIKLSIKKIRDLNKGFVTNFYLNSSTADIWMKNHLLWGVNIGESVFFLRKDFGFTHIYFSSTTMNNLEKDIQQFYLLFPDTLFTVDIIGNAINANEIAGLFLKNRFFTYTSLVRMSKFLADSAIKKMLPDNDVYTASEKDISKIHELLNNFFDPLAEQLPLIEELLGWVNQETILLCQEDGHIQGFLIFEVKGVTTYLRYWFVHPDHREKRMGSKLMQAFFQRNQNAKRQIFWVIRDNDNAIKRYIHYGFQHETLIDIIVTNREIKYGEKNNKYSFEGQA